MGKIFVFGFDLSCPKGGLRDLKLVLDDEGGELVGSDMLIKPEVLRQALEARGLDHEVFQVVHFDMHGGVLLTELWRRYSPQALEQCPELRGAKHFALRANVLSLAQVDTDEPGETG